MMEILGYFFGLLKAVFPFLGHPRVYKFCAWVTIKQPANNGVVPTRTFRVAGGYFAKWGKEFFLFHVENNKYWPQGTAILNPTHKTWHKDVRVGQAPNTPYVLIIAALSKDCMLTTTYYNQIHDELMQRNPPIDTWVPFEMYAHQVPPGFIELDRITVSFPPV